jgi:hypothetical protein
MFKYNGRYYFNSSDLHGWNASHTYTLSATNTLGPYSEESVMANTDADFSHVSQTGFFITMQGTSQSTVIFAGVRWSDFAGNSIGFNQWVPLTFVGTAPQFQSLSQWLLDAVTGNLELRAREQLRVRGNHRAKRDRSDRRHLHALRVDPEQRRAGRRPTVRKDFGETEKDVSVNTSIASWAQVSVPGITVTNGTCQIGVKTTASANQLVEVDDFTLIKN